MKNTTLRSLCSVNDEPISILEMSKDDGRYAHTQMVRRALKYMKYYDFYYYLDLNEVEMSTNVENQFNDAVYGNHMLYFLSKHCKLLPMLHGFRSDEMALATRIKPHALRVRAKKLLRTLNHLSTHDCNNRIKISRNYQLRYLSHK